jgi:hypothetical protein
MAALVAERLYYERQLSLADTLRQICLQLLSPDDWGFRANIVRAIDLPPQSEDGAARRAFQ